MRASQHLQLYSILFLFLSTFAAAWPWPKWLPEMESLVVRQDNGNDNGGKSTSNASPTQTSSVPKETNTKSGSSPSGSQTGSVTASASRTGNQTQTGTITKKPTNTKHTSYDPRLPAGGLSMLTPAAILGQQYFKVGDFVTFGWNYTSLSATPTAINIMATCTANQQLYTLAANQTVTNATGAITWDTGAYQATAVQNPLLTQIYTLLIYDADSSPSAAAQAGYLAAFNSYTFGMYTPQQYTPLADFQCATCSGALGDLERRAIGMVVGMGVLTVLSFTWFVGGTGVIW